MAYTKSLETTDGVSHPDAYAVLASTTANWIEKTGRMTFKVYHSKASFEGKKDPIWTYDYRIAKLEQPNKNLPAFDDIFADSKPIQESVVALMALMSEWEGWQAAD